MTRTKEIHWKSLYYLSHEHCRVSESDSEITIRSIITGRINAIQYKVEYVIRTTPDWNVRLLEMNYALNNVKHTISALRRDENWIVNGQPRPELKKCTDIDISLTPFTNSLPINRLTFRLNEPQLIEVLYVDVLENTIRAARQQYIRKSDTLFNFQTVPNDFEADIIVDNDGFVVRYPQLFERIST